MLGGEGEVKVVGFGVGGEVVDCLEEILGEEGSVLGFGNTDEGGVEDNEGAGGDVLGCNDALKEKKMGVLEKALTPRKACVCGVVCLHLGATYLCVARLLSVSTADAP